MRPLTDEDVLGPGVLLGREGEIIVELRERLFREHVKLKIAIEGEEFHSAPPEAVPPALQMALGNHSIGVFDAAGKLLAADADVYAAPESKPERADTAELVYRLQAYTTSFGSDTEGLSLLPEAWNTLRADIEEACRVLAVPSPLEPSTQEKS